MKKFGIMSAMMEEITAILKIMKKTKTVTIAQRDYHCGELHGIPVVAVFSRWGKVAASSTATALIDRLEVDSIIFTGVAGAVAKSLNIGDVVISNKVIQHDMDARPLFKRHEIPLLNTTYFNANDKLLSLSNKFSKKLMFDDLSKLISKDTFNSFNIKNPTSYVGTIATGDQFISSSEKTNDLAQSIDNCMAVDMESGAVGQVCNEHNIPFIIFRTISDKADHDAVIDFQKFIPQIAAKYSEVMVSSLFKELKSEESITID